jgi:hypothetical protein
VAVVVGELGRTSWLLLRLCERSAWVGRLLLRSPLRTRSWRLLGAAATAEVSVSRACRVCSRERRACRVEEATM